jgi:LysR family transcriptional regulator, low CO2-responsive transcriptional regulator
LLGPALRRFRQPGSELLRLRIGDARATLTAVEEGLVDVGVLPLAHGHEPSSGIEAEPIADVGQMLVVPRAHALAERTHAELADLAGQRLIVAPEHRPQRRALAAALAERAITWEPVVEVSGWALMIHLVGLGVGLAVVNDFCRLPRSLVGLPLPGLTRLSYAAIRWKGLPVSPASARLWTLLTG